MNEHGLSPPSPLSKPMTTLTITDGDGSSDEVIDTSPEAVRLRMTQRLVDLKEVVVVSPTKIKIKWEVRRKFCYSTIRLLSKACNES